MLIDVKKVLVNADRIMQERFSEPIRSRQVMVITEAICQEFNEQSRQIKAEKPENSSQAVQQLKDSISLLKESVKLISAHLNHTKLHVAYRKLNTVIAKLESI